MLVRQKGQDTRGRGQAEAVARLGLSTCARVKDRTVVSVVESAVPHHQSQLCPFLLLVLIDLTDSTDDDHLDQPHASHRRSYAVLGQEDSAVPKLQSIAAKAVKAGLLASIQVINHLFRARTARLPAS